MCKYAKCENPIPDAAYYPVKTLADKLGKAVTNEKKITRCEK